MMKPLNMRLNTALNRLKSIPMTALLVSELEELAARDLAGAVLQAENLAEILSAADAGLKSGGLAGAIYALQSLSEARDAKGRKAVH